MSAAMAQSPSMPTATPGAKMMYLIKRKPATSREELVAHWFANHMPPVIEAQRQAAAAGRPHATRYIATLFKPIADGTHPWDGVAQLYWDRALPKPKVPFGIPPTDSFQERAEPYWQWATTEYVIIDGPLATAPLTLNAPFPTTRSGFCKATRIVTAKPGIDYAEFYEHWLTVHAQNVVETMRRVGGLRYVVSHSIAPREEPYAGMSELYFHNEDALAQFTTRLQPDGIERYVDLRLPMLGSDTEMVGIP
jgi:hypothetical protein